MSEDEGTDASANGVPSEAESDEETAHDGDSPTEPEADSGVVDDTASTGADVDTRSDENAGDAGEASISVDLDRSESAPETSEDVRRLLDRIAEYDDDLAREVASIAETAREVNATVVHQREELEDLRERIETQAETIEELQETLDAREQELAEKDELIAEKDELLTERDEQIEDHETQIEELKTAVKRKQADFQNYKKRTKKRQEQLEARATEDLVGRIVGVRDNLKRALEEDVENVDDLRDGIEMTLREFDRVLGEENVEEIDPDPGSAVDPQRHEVMVTVDSEQPEGTIADVFTPGYEMADKVIQNAQVTVSNGELTGEDDDSEAAEGHSTDEAVGSDEGEETADPDETDQAADSAVGERDEGDADEAEGEADEVGEEADDGGSKADDTDEDADEDETPTDDECAVDDVDEDETATAEEGDGEDDADDDDVDVADGDGEDDSANGSSSSGAEDGEESEAIELGGEIATEEELEADAESDDESGESDRQETSEEAGDDVNDTENSGEASDDDSNADDTVEEVDVT